MAVEIRLNPAPAEMLARNLPLPQPVLAVVRSIADGGMVGPCQRRQPPQAVAEGQRCVLGMSSSLGVKVPCAT
jgi:hypothetical protein